VRLAACIDGGERLAGGIERVQPVPDPVGTGKAASVPAEVRARSTDSGEFTGVRTARKHIGWYTRGLSGANAFRHRMNTLDTTREQLVAVNAFFDEQQALSDRLVYIDEDAAERGEPNRNEPLAA
jgi:hypothetical protein